MTGIETPVTEITASHFTDRDTIIHKLCYITSSIQVNMLPYCVEAVVSQCHAYYVTLRQI
jgi:hypothetical protein